MCIVKKSLHGFVGYVDSNDFVTSELFRCHQNLHTTWTQMCVNGIFKVMLTPEMLIARG